MNRCIYILILPAMIGFIGGCLEQFPEEPPQKPESMTQEPWNADDMVHIVIQE